VAFRAYLGKHGLTMIRHYIRIVRIEYHLIFAVFQARLYGVYVKVELVSATFSETAKKSRYKCAANRITAALVVLVAQIAYGQLGIVLEKLVCEAFPPSDLVYFVIDSISKTFVHFIDSKFGLHQKWQVRS